MKRPRLLLVGDPSDVQEGTASILGRGGYQVFRAGSSGEALGHVARYRPDLIVLHHGEEGHESTGVLPDHEECRGIPMTVLTSPEREPPRPSGVRRFIYMPCRPRTLLEGIGDVLRTGS